MRILLIKGGGRDVSCKEDTGKGNKRNYSRKDSIRGKKKDSTSILINIIFQLVCYSIKN